MKLIICKWCKGLLKNTSYCKYFHTGIKDINWNCLIFNHLDWEENDR